MITEEHGVCMNALFLAFGTRQSYLERKISYSISAPHCRFEINTIAARSTKYHNRQTSFKALKLHAICPEATKISSVHAEKLEPVYHQQGTVSVSEHLD